MHLLLIRHAETVDNVAGLYAGSRDSALTSHGVLQTRSLGAHLVSRRDDIGPITHIFTSNLQRAFKTADAIAEAVRGSRNSRNGTDGQSSSPHVLRLPELREKHFGSREGQSFKVKTTSSQSKPNLPGRPQVEETSEEMTVRVNRFIQAHIFPILQDSTLKKTVVVVSHGIILNILIEALLLQFPSPVKPLPSSNEPHSTNRSRVMWPNTGVLQARLTEIPAVNSATKIAAPLSVADDFQSDVAEKRFTFSIEFSGNVDHLRGLKKTKGGIGSAAFDSRQLSMDSFFKPREKKRKANEVQP